MSTQPIDIEKLASQGAKYEVSLSNESPEDAIARRDLEAAEAKDRRMKGFIGFVFGVVIISVILAGCIYVFSTGSADAQKLAAGVISAIASGYVGFLVGQSKK